MILPTPYPLSGDLEQTEQANETLGLMTLTRKICGSTATRPKKLRKCGANVVRTPLRRTLDTKFSPSQRPDLPLLSSG